MDVVFSLSENAFYVFLGWSLAIVMILTVVYVGTRKE